MAQRLKRLPAMRETWDRSLGQEDPLEKEMATHSSILAWRIPWMEELGMLQSWGCKKSDTTEQLHFHFTFMRNAGHEEGQAGIKIAGRNINNLRYTDDITLMAESEEELERVLIENERGE